MLQVDSEKLVTVLLLIFAELLLEQLSELSELSASRRVKKQFKGPAGAVAEGFLLAFGLKFEGVE